MRSHILSLPRARRRSLTLWGLAGVVVLASVLRFSYLTDRSLWFDEAFSWRLIQFPFGEFLERAASDVHPVLYYLTLWFWSVPLSLLGVELSLFWMRALSVVFSVATVATMYLAGTTLFRSRSLGLTAALFTAVNAFQVQYAWEARMYSLGTFLLPLTFVFLILTTRALARAWAWWYGLLFGLVTGALLHVHYYAIFSWLALGATKLLFFLWRMRRGGVRPVLRSPNFHASEVGFWLSAVLFLPWLSVFLEQSSRVQESYWIPPMNIWSIPNTMARLFLGGVHDPSHLTAVVSSVLVGVLLVFPLVRGRTRSDLLLVLSFVFPFVGSWFLSRMTSIYQDRYFVFAGLPLLLLLARTVSFLPRRPPSFAGGPGRPTSPRLRGTHEPRGEGGGGQASGGVAKHPLPRALARGAPRLTLVALLALGGLLTVVRFWQELDFKHHPGAAGAAAYLLGHANPRDPVVVSSSFVYFPIAFHLGCGTREIRNEKQGIRGSDRDGRCMNGLDVRLYAQDGQLSHFSGGPILVPEDITGPEVFSSLISHPPSPILWVVDTTGFGGSRLAVPEPLTLSSEQAFPELYRYQGEIIVRAYERK